MNTFKRVIAVPLSILATYLCFAFGKWSLDASTYGVADRSVIIYIGLVVGIAIATFPKQN